MRIIEFIRAALFCGLATLALPSLQAAELLMVESDDCPFCLRFHAEIGKVYPKTDEGRLAPLRTWQLSTPFPESYQLAERVTFTPTFILMDNGKEVDRLTGYQGDEFFWFLIGDMLSKLKS